MRKQKLVLLLMMLIFAANPVVAQLNSSIKNFPFKVGNKFVFKSRVVAFPNYNYVSHFTSYISKDTVVNTRKYFFIDYYMGLSNCWWRTDSVTGNLFVFDAVNSCQNYFKEKLIDSLFAGINDSSKGCGSERLYCKDTSTSVVFNTNTFTKSFYKYTIIANGYSATTRTYASGFGVIGQQYDSHGGGGTGSQTITLKGGIINGVLLGDTSTTSVHLISLAVPENYSLKQNYPNPFNPSTKINYEIKSAGFVSIKVFDLLGKEVASLVNEKQNVGSYAVDFNSTDFSLPSGIYFYTLSAGEFKETRKMVLVK